MSHFGKSSMSESELEAGAAKRNMAYGHFYEVFFYALCVGVGLRVNSLSPAALFSGRV